ncbi:hypothetical protein ABVT39_026923 [Epinephelus coioides]
MAELKVTKKEVKVRDTREVPTSEPKHQPSASAANTPQKRKRASVAPTISPADLPVCSDVAPSPQPSTAPLCDDGPLMIHNRSVEEYQRIYHEVVDDMLRYSNGQLRPYSLALGRRIKQRLWKRLDRPTFTESVNEDGLVHVNASYGVGAHPPQYDVFPIPCVEEEHTPIDMN